MKQNIKRILSNHPTYYIPIIFLSILILISIVGPFITRDPNATNVMNMNRPPSLEYLFGTDNLGRDYFSRVIYGGRVSLLVGVLAMLTSVLIGTIIGFISGYYGGVIDTICMRLVDVLSSIPWLVLVIVLSAILRPGLTTIILVIGCFSWMNIARLVRAETLAAKNHDYVKYAKFINVKTVTILLRHILPIVLPTLIIAATNAISSAIMVESALSFLGMGIQPPMASWGNLLQNAQSLLQVAPHMAILPGIFITLTVYSFNKLGDLVNTLVLREES